MRKIFILIVISSFMFFNFCDYHFEEVFNAKLTHEGTYIIGTESYEPSSTNISSIKDYLVIVHDITPLETQNAIIAASYYNVTNQEFLDENIDFQYIDANVSLLAPIIELEVEDITHFENEILELTNNNHVLHVYTRTEIVCVESLNGEWGPPEDDDGSGHGGASPEYDTSIKIGIYDGGRINANYTYFNNLEIVEYDSSIETSMHTTEVGAIIASEFGNNDYLSLHTVHYENVTVIEAMNWLIANQQVDIINISLGINGNENQGEYDFTSKYLDFLINQYRIPMVKSAGNSYTTDEIVGYDYSGMPIYGPGIRYDKITIPGTGFNLITVGGVKSDNVYYSDTRRLLVDENSNSKPNISAYCYDLISDSLDGTSYSAPRITGRSAKMMGYYPSLLNNIELLYSMIHTAGNKRIISGTGLTSTDPSGLNSHTGAGLFEPFVFETLYPNLQVFSTNHNTQYQQVYYKDISMIKNQIIVSSLFSLQRMSLHPSGEYRNVPITDYQIQVLKDGVVVAASNGQINIEMLEYKATVSGTFRIRVIMNDVPNVSHERIGFSYKITD